MAIAPTVKRNRGQQPFQPTREQRQVVHLLHSASFPHTFIAKKIGISVPTLHKYFRTELDDAHDEVKSSMIAAIARAANNGHWGAAKYWLATQGGPEWRVTENRTIGGDPDAPPIRIAVTQMTDADIDRELAELDQREQVATETRTLAEAVPRRSNGVGH